MAVTATPSSLQLRGLGRQKMRALADKARRLGVTPEQYLRQLVEEDLAIARDARSKTFEQLMGPGREVAEDELDELVEQAREEHHRRVTKRKK
jgi:hypothetical protein